MLLLLLPLVLVVQLVVQCLVGCGVVQRTGRETGHVLTSSAGITIMRVGVDATGAVRLSLLVLEWPLAGLVVMGLAVVRMGHIKHRHRHRHKHRHKRRLRQCTGRMGRMVCIRDRWRHLALLLDMLDTNNRATQTCMHPWDLQRIRRLQL